MSLERGPSCEESIHTLTLWPWEVPTHPEEAGEGRLEVGADGQEEGLTAGDHGHPGGQVPDHVVGRRPHDTLVRIDSKVLRIRGPPSDG